MVTSGIPRIPPAHHVMQESAHLTIAAKKPPQQTHKQIQHHRQRIATKCAKTQLIRNTLQILAALVTTVHVRVVLEQIETAKMDRDSLLARKSARLNVMTPQIVLNVFRSCYLNKLFCKF